MVDGGRNLRNASYIYIQTFFSLIGSLFVSRTTLNLLGVRDFGIYSVVGGVVALFVFINTAMAISTQRHITFEMGRGDDAEVGRVYSASIVIHIAIAVFVILFAEFVAIRLFNAYINIPEDRKLAAHWVFHFAVMSIAFSIMNVPQQALINSKEHFKTSSIISLTFSSLYLISAYALNLVHSRRLEMYSVFIFSSNVILYLIYKFVCRRFYHYRFAFVHDKSLYKELTGFAGWNLLGAASMVLRNQGIGVVLNLFYGVTINASYGIANQVGSAAEQFAQSVVRAFNPSIVKKYGANQIGEMYGLAYMSSRISFYILYLMALPIIFEVDFILKIWLKNVPSYAPIFCMILITNVMIEVLSFPLMTIAQATGKIRMYQITNSMLLAMNIPIVYSVLKYTNKPVLGLICIAGMSFLLLMSRLFFLKRIAAMDAGTWLKSVVMKVMGPVMISSAVVYVIVHTMHSGFVRFLVTLVVGSSVTIISAILIGLETERDMIYKRLTTLRSGF